MTEPAQPRAVYEPPEKEKRCRGCGYTGRGWDSTFHCGHKPAPLGLRPDRQVSEYGTCGYFDPDGEPSND